MLRAGTSLIVVMLLANPSAGQGMLDAFSYEGLRVAGIGFEAGAMGADRLERELAVSLRVDAGLFAPNIRPLLGVTVVRSRYTAEHVAEFENRLRGVVTDPTNDFTIAVGEISLLDIALEGDLQAIANPGGRFSPYIGLGVGVHLRDADGAAITGTFVEDALQTMAATVNGSMGIEIGLTRSLRFSLDLRGMYGSGFVIATGRAGLWIRLPGETP